MRILVTGAAGFLGSHLCEYLLAKGHSVVGMDNFITGSIDNVGHLFANPDFVFNKYDVTNFMHVSGRLDAVLHFASPASPSDYMEHPIPTLKVGALGTHKALGLAKDKKAIFLLASTSEIYGDPQVNPQDEKYWGHVNPVGPRGVYDEAKRFAEALTMAYHRYHGIPVRIARIFNTYGPRMRVDDGRAVPNFMIQCLKNEPLTVFGDGMQTRSLCYVDDMVRGIYALLTSGLNEPVNIGNPAEITVIGLARAVKKIASCNSEIVFKPLPQDDPKVRKPDITLACERLGWKPEISLEEGLRKTLEYFKAKLLST